MEEYVLELSGPEKRVDVIRWDGADVFALHFTIETSIKNLIQAARFDGLNYRPDEFGYRLFHHAREIFKGQFSPVVMPSIPCLDRSDSHSFEGIECWRFGLEMVGKKVCKLCSRTQKTILSQTGHKVELD